jgi:hypothetical protein
MVPPTWRSTHRDSGRFGFALVNGRGCAAQPHIEGKIKGDLPHPDCADYAAAEIWLQGA